MRAPAAWRTLPALALLLALPGCRTPGPHGPADSFGLDFALPPAVETRGAVVFFVDGVNASVFSEMLQAGELPAVRRYFVERGLYCPRAVGSMPAATIPNQVSVATGVLPGHHGVVGIRWFDRNQLAHRDYATIAQKNRVDGDFAAPTLYEQFPDRPTFSGFFQVHRGATVFQANTVPAGVSFFAGFYQHMDRMTLNMFHDVVHLARSTRQFPAVAFCYQLAPDFTAYRVGMENGRYRDALRHTDRQIGRVLGDMERAGLLDKLVIALVSDHGMTPASRHLDLRDVLGRQAGLDLAAEQLSETAPFPARQAAYERRSAVLTVFGNRFGGVYLRKPARRTPTSAEWSPWLERPTADDLLAFPARDGRAVNLPEMLAGLEAVDAAAYSAGAEAVRVRRKGGEVEFRQPAGPGGEITYKVVSGEDPLEWHARLPADLRAGAAAGPRRWLEATTDTPYPDLPAQVLAYFRHRRSADVAVFAAPGWDFLVENRAGHGGIRREDVLVPLLLAGPGVPKGAVPVARTVDLAPTLLKLLDRPLPPGMDGAPLAEIAK